jgi:hypothetical protein
VRGISAAALLTTSTLLEGEEAVSRHATSA